MRRGAIINKKRVLDFCLAKGNDTRVDNTNPLNPVYPVFSYSHTPFTEVIPTATGELLLRNSIKQDGVILNTLIQLRPNMASGGGVIGDNKQRNQYPSGVLELHHRVHKTQLQKLQLFHFRSSGGVTGYSTNYLDFSKTTGAKYVHTTQNLEKVSFLNLKNAVEFVSLRIYNHNITTLDISDNLKLVTVDLGSGDINTVITNSSVYDFLTGFHLANNKLTSFNINAPNLTALTLPNNQLVSLPSPYAPNLLTLNVANNLLTSADFSDKAYLNITNLNISDNRNLESIDLSLLTELTTLNIYHCKLTTLDISNNTKLRIINLQASNSTYIYSNNFIDRTFSLQDLYACPDLREFTSRRENLGCRTGEIFDFANLPNLQKFTLASSSGSFTTPNSILLTQLELHSSSLVGIIDFALIPNLNYLRIDNTGAIDLINWSSLTKLTTLLISSITNSSLTLVDLSYLINNLSLSMAFAYNPYITTVLLPTKQINNNSEFPFYNCSVLSNFVVNNISRTNTSVIVTNLNLSVLDTSFGATNCFPNLTFLALGGVGDTYTSTKVFDDRKNFLDTFLVLGTIFQVNGNLGTDVLNVATFMEINGSADLSYTGGGDFGATMRRVFIRPKAGSGLVTDGNQIADLIIKLSTKTWTTSTTTISIGGTNYAQKVIDLRGNCAVATPSTALTTALALLTTKGVTVLRN